MNIHKSDLMYVFFNYRYNLGDYSGEIVSEVMAQRQPMKPTYAIPIIPVTNSSPFKHQETMELKEYKVKVSNVDNKVVVCCNISQLWHFRIYLQKIFLTGREVGAFGCWKQSSRAAIEVECFVLLE